MIVVTTFRLRPGAADEPFLELDGRVQVELAYHEAGLVRRTTARSDDGTWLVIELWHAEHDADASVAARAGDPLHTEYQTMIDPGSMRTDRFSTFD